MIKIIISLAVSFTIGVMSTLAYNVYYSPSLTYYKETLDFSVPSSGDADLYSDLEILYKGRKYKSFYTTKLVLINDGGEHLSATSSKSPIKINVKGIEYYSLDGNNSNPTATILKEGDILNLSFDYLNVSDQIVVNLIHKGKVDITVDGALHGINKIPYKEKYDLPMKQIVLSTLFWIVFSFGLFIIVVVILSFIFSRSEDSYSCHLARRYKGDIGNRKAMKRFVYYKRNRALEVDLDNAFLNFEDVPERQAMELLRSKDPHKFIKDNKFFEKYEGNHIGKSKGMEDITWPEQCKKMRNVKKKK